MPPGDSRPKERGGGLTGCEQTGRNNEYFHVDTITILLTLGNRIGLASGRLIVVLLDDPCQAAVCAHPGQGSLPAPLLFGRKRLVGGDEQ